MFSNKVKNSLGLILEENGYVKDENESKVWEKVGNKFIKRIQMISDSRIHFHVFSDFLQMEIPGNDKRFDECIVFVSNNMPKLIQKILDSEDRIVKYAIDNEVNMLDKYTYYLHTASLLDNEYIFTISRFKNICTNEIFSTKHGFINSGKI